MSAQYGRSGLACVLMLHVISVDASAQTSKEFLGARGGGIFYVAACEAVQVELGITAESKAKLRVIVNDYTSERSAARDAMAKVIEEAGVNGGDNTKLRQTELHKLEARVAAANERFQEQMVGTMSVQQMTRLKQITWQVYGSESLASDPELIRALDLQPSHLEKIRSINDEDRRSRLERLRRGTALPEIDKERDLKAVEVLVESQRGKYRQMTGKPFDLALLVPKEVSQQRRSDVAVEMYRTFVIGTNCGIFSLAANQAVQNELGVGREGAAKVTAVTELFNRAWLEAGGEFRMRQSVVANGGRRRFQEAAIPPFGIRDDQEKSVEENRVEVERKSALWRATIAKYSPQLKEALSEDQFTRLQQINLQAMGVSAYLDADIVEALSLSANQQAKIKDLVEAYRIKGEDLVRRAISEKEEVRSIRRKVEELTKTREAETRQVLSMSQLRKLDAMKGKEFDLEQLGDQDGLPARAGRGGALQDN